MKQPNPEQLRLEAAFKRARNRYYGARRLNTILEVAGVLFFVAAPSTASMVIFDKTARCGEASWFVVGTLAIFTLCAWRLTIFRDDWVRVRAVSDSDLEQRNIEMWAASSRLAESGYEWSDRTSPTGKAIHHAFNYFKRRAIKALSILVNPIEALLKLGFVLFLLWGCFILTKDFIKTFWAILLGGRN